MMYNLPIKDWLLYAYALVCPFFVFSVFFTRDTPSNWVTVFMLLVTAIDFISSGGRFWLDRSMVYLLVFGLIYLVSTGVILFHDPTNTWADRTPLQRAMGVDIRLILTIVTFFALVHHLVDAPSEVFYRVLQFQFFIGVSITVFGLLQYVSYTVFNSSALIGIESTNEAFKMPRGNLFTIGKEKAFRASAVFSEPSYFGFFLVPLLVKSIVAYLQRAYFFSRNMHAGMIVIFALGILSNFSFTAILAVFLLVCVAGVVFFRKAPTVVAAVVVLGVMFFGALLLSPVGGIFVERLSRAMEFKDLSTLARFMSAYVGFLVFLDNPVFGVGPGGFAFLFPKMGIFIDRNLMHTPLNIWFSILTDVGIVGFIPFIAILWSILRRAIRNMDIHPLISVFLWSTVSYLLLLTTVDFWFLDMFWFELAILLTLSASPHARSLNSTN